MKVRLTLGALLAVAAFLAGPPPGAQAATAVRLSCGDTITADTTLDSDLVGCPNNGIVIGADNISLDLNGHAVAGNGEPVKGCPQGDFCDVGVLNDGHDGVTVRHGSVRDFGVGVSVTKARHNQVLRLSSSRNRFFGIMVAESARSLVRDSSGNGNVAPNGDGMGLFGSHHVRVLHNSFRRNAQLGIHVVDSTNNLIEANRVTRNQTAIEVEANRNQVRGNRLSRNGNGIGIAGNRNLIRGNRVDFTRGAGGGFGVPLEHGDHNVIERNLIRNTRAAGISIGFEPGAYNLVRGNRIRGAGEAGVLIDSKGKQTVLIGNVVSAAGEDGILVKSKAQRTRLTSNHSFGAKDDGIDVDSSMTKLTRNEARGNGDLGIEAVRGVLNGGGNRASRNGNPLQCTNIFCR